METFCKNLPKIELHAHLNGSLSESTLKQLQRIKNVDNDDISNFKFDHSKSTSECFAVFKIAQALTDTPDAVKLATSLTLQEFNDDGVLYMELRSTPRRNPKMTKVQYIQSMVDAIIDTSNLIEMKTCVLTSIDRRNTVEEAEETIIATIEMAKKYPHIIVGIDFSGDPHIGIFGDFTKILDTSRCAGLKVTVHAAEIPNEKETLEILEWKPDRLGHVTYNSERNAGSKHLWNAILKSQIPIELCLTSNVKCGTVKSYADHHFKQFFEAKHPISLATDDKGVFGSTLSEEYDICAKTFDLSEEQLWNISYNAISQIFANDDIKQNLSSKLIEFKNNNFKSMT
ncbi:adenosine deaminase-like protein [Arctopsyche grandis]|uniref:adenosine deaminase-like protein n=1 Tax=Arctopsyche grandis TaxID=121162 RepID=UPI00406D9C11